MKKRKNAGVSMMEVLVVIILLFMTSTIWVMNRKKQMEVAYKMEAQMVIDDIRDKQKIVYAAISKYETVNSPTSSAALMGGVEHIDIKRNMYFTSFKITSGEPTKGYVIHVYGERGGPMENVTITHVESR